MLFRLYKSYAPLRSAAHEEIQFTPVHPENQATPMRVLTIIVSYNFERWMERCLNSLLHSEHPTDIVVIDNGSTDRTLSLLRSRYPDIRLIACQCNLGFGCANNVGLSIALAEGYDAAFLLNQDAWVDEKVIGTLTSLLAQQPQYGILSPVHLTGKGDELDAGFADYAHLSSITQLPKEESVTACSFLNAAFWMLPVSTIRSVGGFSPLFYHYGEDKDYINRLTCHGLLIGYVPTVFGCHDRAWRSVSAEMRFHTRSIYLLSEYANVNHSFCAAFTYGVLAGVKELFSTAVKGNAAEAKRYLFFVMGLLKHSCRILSIRRQVKTVPSVFIPTDIDPIINSQVPVSSLFMKAFQRAPSKSPQSL
jgi:GT2 family glycosyltransferase